VTDPERGETFAQLMKRLMDTYQVNESDIARATSMSTSAVNLWVRGERYAPRKATLEKLAAAFPKIPRDDFFAAAGRKTPGPVSPDRKERIIAYLDDLTAEQQEFVEITVKAQAEHNRSSSS
jgi:transcriptional regulator with XRE-family HTH domain